MALPKIGKKALEAISNGVQNKHHISYLEQLGIGQRIINLLESEGVHELGDLMGKQKEELLSYNNFGQKQLESLFGALANYHNLNVLEYES